MIESIDLKFLRKLLKAPITTPKEIIFLELGVLPLRDIIKQRRLNFLFYIIKQKDESMIKRVFQSQIKNKSKKDWITTILKDIEELNLNVTFEDIKKMSKGHWTNIIKESIKYNVFRNLFRRKTHTVK